MESYKDDVGIGFLSNHPNKLSMFNTIQISPKKKGFLQENKKILAGLLRDTGALFLGCNSILTQRREDSKKKTSG